MKLLLVIIGLGLIALGFLPAILLLDLLEPILAPLFPPLTEVEAEYKCLMLERSYRWGYDGGVFDCFDYYTAEAESTLVARVSEKLWSIVIVSVISFKLFLGGGLLLYYAEQSNIRSRDIL